MVTWLHDSGSAVSQNMKAESPSRMELLTHGSWAAEREKGLEYQGTPQGYVSSNMLPPTRPCLLKLSPRPNSNTSWGPNFQHTSFLRTFKTQSTTSWITHPNQEWEGENDKAHAETPPLNIHPPFQQQPLSRSTYTKPGSPACRLSWLPPDRGVGTHAVNRGGTCMPL